jgi:hypothetical protein
MITGNVQYKETGFPGLWLGGLPVHGIIGLWNLNLTTPMIFFWIPGRNGYATRNHSNLMTGIKMTMGIWLMA